MNKTPKIAFEEHFSAPGFADYSKGFVANLPGGMAADINSRLTDFDDSRLEAMDMANIEYAILAQTLPGVQGEPDVQRAVRLASENNDYLAEKIARHPTRYGGFAHLSMHDPLLAAKELERAVKQLGFKGAMVNGHTLGSYYDDPRFDPFWACVQELDVPFYLHPIGPFDTPHVYKDHPELIGACWGWGVETGAHALRLLFGGVFDRFPDLKLILGHMGEGLPFLRWRLDSRFAAYPHGISLKKAPSEYIGSNIVITTSGVCSSPTLVAAIGEMGAESVMFSIDYPYEDTTAAADFIESADLSDEVRRQVCYDNAKRLFKL